MLKIGVAVVMMVLVGGSLSYSFANGVNAIQLLWLSFSNIVAVTAGWHYARYVSIRIDGDDIYIRRWFRNRVFPLSDLLEVSVRYCRGIPWTVFRFSNQGNSSVLNFYTMLKPDIIYYCRTGTLADLAILEGVSVRYLNPWGRERRKA